MHQPTHSQWTTSYERSILVVHDRHLPCHSYGERYTDLGYAMKIVSVRVTDTERWKHAYTISQQGLRQPVDKHIASLPTFDNTKLVAINTCPLWGITRYTHHKVMNAGGRAMALEAGGAAHEFFAAHRLYSFREFGRSFYDGAGEEAIHSAFAASGERVFGAVRFNEALDTVDEREDFRTRLQQFCLTVLYNCGFYDDPGDKRRTMTNVEEMCIAYADKFSWEHKLPYWDGQLYVGVEIPVDVIIEIMYTSDTGTVYNDEGIELPDENNITIRFIGKADGLHYSDRTRTTLRVHENKTASRLGDAWEMSWETNHQPTGYIIALAAMMNLPIREAEMLGTALPLPKSYTINGVSRVVVKRKEWQLEEWFKWLLHTTGIHETHKDDPANAPQYTHSCNRYFRPCSFIPLCATEPEERAEMINEMAVQEWSPLHKEGEGSDD